MRHWVGDAGHQYHSRLHKLPSFNLCICQANFSEEVEQAARVLKWKAGKGKTPIRYAIPGGKSSQSVGHLLLSKAGDVYFTEEEMVAWTGAQVQTVQWMKIHWRVKVLSFLFSKVEWHLAQLSITIPCQAIRWILDAGHAFEAGNKIQLVTTRVMFVPFFFGDSLWHAAIHCWVCNPYSIRSFSWGPTSQFQRSPSKSLDCLWDFGEKQPESILHVREGPEFQQELVVLEGVIR